MGRLFDLGVRKGGTIFIWASAEGHNFYLGVREYLKDENPSNHNCINKKLILFFQKGARQMFQNFDD